MEDCIFCKIDKEIIPSPKVYEDEYFFIIKDIEPKAKYHYLAIPHKHFKFLKEMDKQGAEALAHIFGTLPKIATKLGLDGGFRLIINQGDDAGQTVPHLHIHILGGQNLEWKPA